MVDKTTHRVFDHVTPSGEIVTYKFTYNEGLMIAAAVALHEVTKDSKYLAKAHAIAGFLITEETTPTPLGPVLHDGDDVSCTGDCPQFKGIAYRGLAALDAADPRPAYAKVLDATDASLRTAPEIRRAASSASIGRSRRASSRSPRPRARSDDDCQGRR